MEAEQQTMSSFAKNQTLPGSGKVSCGTTASDGWIKLAVVHIVAEQ